MSGKKEQPVKEKSDGSEIFMFECVCVCVRVCEDLTLQAGDVWLCILFILVCFSAMVLLQREL